MRIKNSIFIVIALFSGLITKGQYDITFEVKGATDDTIILGYHYIGATYAIDTAINHKGKFHFKSKDKVLEDGIYFFSNTKGSFCEFIITDSRKMQFKTSQENWVKNLNVKGSQDERLYLDYLRQQEVITGQFRNLSSQTLDKKEYDARLNVLRQSSDSLKENFISNNPEHFLSHILMASKRIDIPEFEIIYTPDGQVDSVALNTLRWNYYKEHYFDNVRLDCSGLIRTPKEVFLNMYNNFFDNVMKYETADTIIHYADMLIDRAKGGYQMQKFLINDIARRYLQDNIMGHDKIYVHMIDKYFKTGMVAWMHPSDIQMNIERADKWRNLLIGQVVPNLACPENDENSTWHSLSDLENRYKVLVFWSIECGHCATEIPKLLEFYNNNSEQYNLEIFAVHTEGDINRMHEFVEEKGIKWINVNGLYANYDWHTYFDIEKTPVIYILDKDNKILAKNIAAERLHDIINLLERGGFNL